MEVQAGHQTINGNKKRNKTMKKIFLAALTVIGLMVSCSQIEDFDTNTNKKIDLQPTPGGEVDFGISLGDVTRTVYGDEDIDNETGKPTSRYVGWTDGDIVSVFGTNVSKSFYNAKYKVSITNDQQDYADYLEHTGDYGVQWGDDVISDFISIYSPECSSFDYTKSSTEYYYALNENEGNITFEQTTTAPSDDDKELLTSYAYTASASISNVQNIVFDGRETFEEALSAYSVKDTLTKECMPNLIMYARTDRVIAGETVNLRYKPFTTVLNFQFKGFDTNLQSLANGVQIKQIVVEAPSNVNIAGDFKLNVTGSQADAKAEIVGNVTNGSNTITINTYTETGSYFNLPKGKAMNFNVFAIPNPYTISSNSQWTMTFHTVENGSYTFTMKPTTGVNIPAGVISKLPIPGMTFNNTVKWNYAKWMTQIPQKVYLSELSVPGAWYATKAKSVNDGYQVYNNTQSSLQDLYACGVRAFNIDCRITRKTFEKFGSYKWSDSDYSSANLVCSGTEEGHAAYIASGITNEGTTVLSAVKDIINIAQNNQNEIVFIVFTYAEKPMTESGVNCIFGTTNPIYITERLKGVLTDPSVAPYLYTNITKDTTIEDVLEPDANGIVRNIIVKINHTNASFYSGDTFDMPVGHMASYAPMAMITSYNNTYWENSYNSYITITKNDTDFYSKMQTSEIYTAKNSTTTDGSPVSGSNNMTYYYHQAQRTYVEGDGTPTIAERMNAIDDIIEQAKSIYQNSTHNAFFQLGIGGMMDNDDSKTNLDNQLQPHVLTHIKTKAIEAPSPLGFVLMNNCVKDYNKADVDGENQSLIKEIIQMNGRFYLNREGGIVVGGNGSGNSNPNQ